MTEVRISPRERMVLTAIIDLYIATGEPVASQSVARFFANREGLSSATIRNVMATLGETGLLDQPHTSAGRVPTAAAFRYYVEQITRPEAQASQLAAAQAAPMSEARRGQIEDSFTGVTSTNDYLERTSHVLALLSSGLGVALASSTASQVLEHIHFSRLSTGRVLAVLVTQAGAVQDRVLALDRELTHLELETAGRYLNENFRGWPVERIRAEVARRIELEETAYHQMLASVEELCRKGALAARSSSREWLTSLPLKRTANVCARCFLLLKPSSGSSSCSLLTSTAASRRCASWSVLILQDRPRPRTPCRIWFSSVRLRGSAALISAPSPSLHPPASNIRR